MSKQILRDIKLALLTNESNDIVNWFNELWDSLIKVETDVKHTNGGEEIYYLKLDYYTTNERGYDKQVIFYKDKKDKLFCDHNYYLNDLKFNIRKSNGYDYLTDDDLLVITKILFESKVNDSVADPMYQLYDNCSSRVEHVLNKLLPNKRYNDRY